MNLLVRCHVFSITLALDMADTGVHSPLDIDMTMCTKKEVRIFTNNYNCCSYQKNVIVCNTYCTVNLVFAIIIKTLFCYSKSQFCYSKSQSTETTF